MEWEITGDRPVYLQLVEQLELGIITGQYASGEKLPPVRELAAQAEVNPNTMQRALQALEARGLLLTQRTAGRIVTADRATVEALRHDRATALAKAFLQQMQALHINKSDAAALLQQVYEEEQG